MIKKIQVDGYKSLSAFELDLMEGLNILVGPNGSGKTNVITFFEFLSAIVNHSIGDAVGRLGGAGYLFKKLPTGDYQSKIKVCIYGVTHTFDSKYLYYKYSFEVALTEGKDFVYFSAQRLCVSFQSKKINESLICRDDFSWDLDVESVLDKSVREGILASKFEINKIDRRKIDTSYRITPEEVRRKSKRDILGHISTQLSGDLFLNESFLSRLSEFFSIGPMIARDVCGGETIHIDPSKAKISEDTAAPAGINRDGSGLSSTLYALSKGNRVLPSNSPFMMRSSLLYKPQPVYTESMRKQSQLIFKEIERFSAIVNPNISKISVDANALENKTQISIWMKDDNGTIQIPFSLMSDGTVKWIALVAAILTHRSIFAIEEPENFLHPHMQKELLEMMRGQKSKGIGGSFSIMSTHSESLLNAADPNEIVVVNFANGKTTAFRPRNAKLIREEISRTGFGLGYYYLSEALSDD